MEESKLEGLSVEPEVELQEDLSDLAVTQSILEEGFFGKKYYLSPSALGKYLWRPKAWYDWYVLKQKEDRKETKALIEGSLIHLLILESQNFDKKYCISKEGLVKDKQKDLLDKLYAFPTPWTTQGKPDKLVDMSRSILAMMKQTDYFQSLREDSARLSKVITPQAEEYWEFLKKKEGKTMVSQEQYDFCSKAAKLITSDALIREQLGLDDKEGEVYNELEMQCELENYSFGLKGILDNLHIDHKKKVITINDVKTTTKTLKEFAKESIRLYDIDLQLALYALMVHKNYKELIEKGYDGKVNIIVVTQHGDYYSFPVSDDTVIQWVLQLRYKLDEFAWNYNKRNFSNHRDFIERVFEL